MTAEIYALIRKYAEFYSIDRALIYGIICAESSGNPYAIRYEPKFIWLKDPPNHAKLNGHTDGGVTEAELQKCSWGLMQIMGGTARDVGYTGPLQALCVPELGVKYGSMYLARLFRKYGKYPDTISAYNQGSVKRAPDGNYVNGEYVRRVAAFQAKYEDQ